jgi:hypothetical protein
MLYAAKLEVMILVANKFVVFIDDVNPVCAKNVEIPVILLLLIRTVEMAGS